MDDQRQDTLSVPRPLSDLHRLIALMTFCGQPPAEIAKTLNIAPQTVGRVKADENTKLYLANLRRDFEQRLLSTTTDIVTRFERGRDNAVGAIEELVREADRDATRLKAATTWLEYTPSVPRRKSADGDEGIHVHLGARTLQNMVIAMREVGAPLPEVIDAEVLPSESANDAVISVTNLDDV